MSQGGEKPGVRGASRLAGMQVRGYTYFEFIRLALALAKLFGLI